MQGDETWQQFVKLRVVGRDVAAVRETACSGTRRGSSL